MTRFTLSWQEYHIHQMSVTRAGHCCEVRQTEERKKTIMFLSSKLCLLIALLLGWLLMDITFRAVPQATVWSSAFWNERLCDALLKLVQRSVIHHRLHCQREAATSPCFPVTIGLHGELLSAISQCCSMHWAGEIAANLHFFRTWETTALQQLF